MPMLNAAPEHPAPRTQKTILSLVPSQSNNLETSQSTMNTAAAPQATATPAAQMGPRLSRLADMHLADHVHMVHNALDAVQCLTMPRGFVEKGTHAGLEFLTQGSLSDLLEIINDRLAIALEARELRAVN